MNEDGCEKCGWVVSKCICPRQELPKWAQEFSRTYSKLMERHRKFEIDDKQLQYEIWDAVAGCHSARVDDDAARIEYNVLSIVSGVCMADPPALRDLKRCLNKQIGNGYYEGDGDGVMIATVAFIDKMLEQCGEEDK